MYWLYLRLCKRYAPPNFKAAIQLAANYKRQAELESERRVNERIGYDVDMAVETARNQILLKELKIAKAKST